MPSMLYKGEKVYDHTNFSELLGDGQAVHACGDVRLLSRTPPPAGEDRRAYAKAYGDHFPIYDRQTIIDKLTEQLKRKRRVSDIEAWPALDQNGTPQCWSNGPAGCAATVRVIMGLPYIQLSPASVACPISNGTSGGYEGDAVRYGKEHGWAPSCIFPQHATGRSLLNDPKVIESRKKFMLLELFDLGNDYLAMQSCLADGWPCLAAYPDWSHVTEIADGVVLDRNALGHRARNSWSDNWGAKNEAGFGGYAVFREDGGPHSRVDGIFAIRQMTPDPAREYLKAA